jgi:Flp pilus assembly protein TadB
LVVVAAVVIIAIVAVVASVVAVATTLVILALRARAKKKAWYEQEAFDYDVDDCAGFDGMDADFTEPLAAEAEA